MKVDVEDGVKCKDDIVAKELNNKDCGAAVVDHDSNNGSNQEDVSVVNGIFVLEGCPQGKVDKSIYKSLAEIIDHKDHLRRNIIKVLFGSIKKKESSNLKFQHEIQTIFRVNRRHLWENAQTYLSKHLGASNWSLSDGTHVTFAKIHQK